VVRCRRQRRASCAASVRRPHHARHTGVGWLGVDRSVAIFRGLFFALLIATCLALPGAARALGSPQVFYAEGDVSSYEGAVPPSLWLPLAGAEVSTLTPTIGVRLQYSGSDGTAHTFKIEALSVPDGHPSQEPSYWGGCISAVGTIGQVAELQQLGYEGPGSYTIRVTAFDESEAQSTHCTSGGVATTVTFRIVSRPVLHFSARTLLAGGPRTDAHGGVIGLIETLPPLAWDDETVCALNAHVAADGSVSGSQTFRGNSGETSQHLFPGPGKWTCVARAFAGVRNPPPGESNSTRATAWSAPVSAFFRTEASIAGPLRIVDGTAPGFVLAGKLNRAAAGGILTLHLTPAGRCPAAVAPEVAHARVRADGSFRLKLRLSVARTRRGKLSLALWNAVASFSGTPLVVADQKLGVVVHLGRSVGFVPGIGYLKPLSERHLQFFAGGDCIDYA
jgi:hypothetical protein